jgi:hypothetical protein
MNFTSFHGHSWKINFINFHFTSTVHFIQFNSFNFTNFLIEMAALNKNMNVHVQTWPGGKTIPAHMRVVTLLSLLMTVWIHQSLVGPKRLRTTILCGSVTECCRKVTSDSQDWQLFISKRIFTAVFARVARVAHLGGNQKASVFMPRAWLHTSARGNMLRAVI